MSRLRKIVKIGDKEITVKELTVKELLYMAHKVGWIPLVEGTNIEGIEDLSFPDLALRFSSDATKKDIILLAPSEVETLYNVFLDLNKTVFSTVSYLGLDKAIESFKNEIVQNFLSDLSGEVTKEISKSRQE